MVHFLVQPPLAILARQPGAQGWLKGAWYSAGSRCQTLVNAAPDCEQLSIRGFEAPARWPG